VHVRESRSIIIVARIFLPGRSRRTFLSKSVEGQTFASGHIGDGRDADVTRKI
jgi:hypothetical protein